MSHEVIYKGKEIDIEKTFDGLTLYSLHDGRVQRISIEDKTDMDVLYSLIGDIVSKDYAASQLCGPLDYDLEGC